MNGPAGGEVVEATVSTGLHRGTTGCGGDAANAANGVTGAATSADDATGAARGVATGAAEAASSVLSL